MRSSNLLFSDVFSVVIWLYVIGLLCSIRKNTYLRRYKFKYSRLRLIRSLLDRVLTQLSGVYCI